MTTPTPLRKPTAKGRQELITLLEEYRKTVKEVKEEEEKHLRPSELDIVAAHSDLLTNFKAVINDDELAPIIDKNIKVLVGPLADKLLTAEFFHNNIYVENIDALKDCGISPSGDGYLWTGLDALFAEYTLRNTKNKPWVGELSRHIYGYEPRRVYRHLIGGPAEIYSVLNDTPHLMRVFMTGSFHLIPDEYEQVAGRRNLISDRTALKLACQLYLDPTTNKPYNGVASEGITGGFRDFGTVHSQLNVTKHLRVVPEEKLLELLPEEFNTWITQAAST